MKKRMFTLMIGCLGINTVQAEIITRDLDLEIVSTEDFMEVGIDFDLDGADDFTYQTKNFSPAYYGYKGYFGSHANNEIVCPGYLDLTNFNEGEEISAETEGWYNSTGVLEGEEFFLNPRVAYRFGDLDYSFPNGNFVNADHKYIGVRFKIEDEFHYGYVEISIDITDYPGVATIHKIGYNSVAGEPIMTGQVNDVGIQSNDDLIQISVFPNPVTDILYLETVPGQLIRLVVYDQRGRVVLQDENPGEKISLVQLEKGIYFLRLMDAMGSEEVKKIVKK